MSPTDPVVITAAAIDPLLSASERRSRVRSGTLVRVRRGAYALGSDWAASSADDRYRAVIRAAATAQREQRVFSHQSAAALWGLPNIGPWPDDVHLLVPKTTGGRSDPGVRRHALGVDDRDVTLIDGIAVTTLARTLVDLAATSHVYSAVAALDAAFFTPRFGSGPLITRDAVLDQWDRQGPFRGFRRAHRLIEFAETGAASPSESGSRVTMAVLGFPAPELQHHFLVDGGDAWTDFFWESVRGVGECDGETKYEDPEFLRGRSVAEVVRAEKRREDAIRRQVRGFQRWGSAEAFSPRALRPQLLELGLVPGVPRLRGR